MILEYGDEEMEYLCKKDKALAEVIHRIGRIDRECEDDIFTAIVHNIAGQQISMKALSTIWKRMIDKYGEINVESMSRTDAENMSQCGISNRKAGYILEFAYRVKNSDIDLDSLYMMDDEEVITELTRIKGIGRWTAEMIMLFCMKRKNIFSYDDLGIKRGLKIIYHHREITRALFDRYRRRFSPYGSIASLYLWEVSNETISGLHNDAERKKI